LFLNFNISSHGTMIEMLTSLRQCFKRHVMPAWVGMSVGAVRCLQKGWRWGVSVEVEQRGFVRPKQPHFGEQAMRHNKFISETPNVLNV
jgi:hypothetical protein